MAMSYMLNTILPLRLGDVSRVFIIKTKTGAPMPQSFSALLVERGFDAVTIVAMGAFTAWALDMPRQLVAGGGLVAAGAVVLLLLLIVWKPEPAAVRQGILRVIDSPVWAEKIAQLFASFNLGLGWMEVVVIALYSAIVWLTEAAGYYLIGLAFGFAWSPAAAVFTTAVVNLATMIPSSPGYIGTFQYMAVLALGQLTIPFNAAVAYSVVAHILVFAPITLIGYFLFLRSGITVAGLAMQKKG